MRERIGLIIRREFSTRVRKKTFIILTILGPILMAALFVLPAYLATLPGEERTISVLDEPLLLDFDKGKDDLKLRYLPPQKFSPEEAIEFSRAQGDYAFMHIPPTETGDPDWLARNIKIYRDGDVTFSVENYLESRIEKYLQNEKLKASGVDPEIIARTKTKVNLRTINTEVGKETENAVLLKMGIGYVTAFLVYIFVFLYAAQVMRGVIEEKTSRIMEVIISSVKPFELMMGKIIGVALVALLQFVIWLVFGGLLYALSAWLILGDAMQGVQNMPGQVTDESQQVAFEVLNTLSVINFPLIIGVFTFYFLIGYLLYAAFFAAIGSVVDKESDSGQFSLPVSIPLIIALVVLFRALDQPDGALAFWFSLIPFTSPVVMMARIPFGVPAWELILSMGLLVLAFVGAVWFAARIYRTGVLMYGKKPTFRELFRWLRY